MKKIISDLLKNAHLNFPATRETLAEVELKMGIQFPDQYISFMLESNGVEGNVGESSYLAIWPAEQIVMLNEEYAVNEFTPGLIYFGSDGGGVAYAFDRRDDKMPIVEIPFESIDIGDIKLLGNTFVDFLQCLYDQ